MSRAARGSGRDFERSDPFFTPTPGPRGPDSRFSRAARGNNLGKSTENSSPQPPLLRAGTQPPPRGVPTPADRPRAAEPLGVPRVGAHTPAPGVSVRGSKGRSWRSGGVGELTLGESVGESEDPDEEAQHAVLPPCARPRLGPGVGEGARGAGWGGGEPGSPPPARPRPPLHTHTHTHSRAQTHFPSLRFSFISPSSRSRLSLPLPLSRPAFLPPRPFIISRLELYLSGSLSLSALPFSPLVFLPSLPPSLLLTSTLPPTAPPSTALPLPPQCARTHTHSHPSLQLRWTERQERKRWRAKRVTT